MQFADCALGMSHANTPLSLPRKLLYHQVLPISPPSPNSPHCNNVTLTPSRHHHVPPPRPSRPFLPPMDLPSPRHHGNLHNRTRIQRPPPPRLNPLHGTPRSPNLQLDLRHTLPTPNLSNTTAHLPISVHGRYTNPSASSPTKERRNRLAQNAAENR